MSRWDLPPAARVVGVVIAGFPVAICLLVQVAGYLPSYPFADRWVGLGMAAAAPVPFLFVFTIVDNLERRRVDARMLAWTALGGDPWRGPPELRTGRGVPIILTGWRMLLSWLIPVVLVVSFLTVLAGVNHPEPIPRSSTTGSVVVTDEWQDRADLATWARVGSACGLMFAGPCFLSMVEGLYGRQRRTNGPRIS